MVEWSNGVISYVFLLQGYAGKTVFVCSYNMKKMSLFFSELVKWSGKLCVFAPGVTFRFRGTGRGMVKKSKQASVSKDFSLLYCGQFQPQTEERGGNDRYMFPKVGNENGMNIRHLRNLGT